MIFIKIIVFIFGLVIGSFLNVVIYRLPRRLSVVWGRSFCPKCKKKISWFDNVPLVSYLVLKGHCRSCRSPISFRYPLVELLTGVLFLFSYLSHLGFLSYLLFAALIVIFFIDLEHQIIPDEIIFPLIALFSFRQIILLFSLSPITYHLSPIFSAVGASLFLFLIYLFTKGKGMGFGDVKLAFLMGLSLGFPKVIIAFYVAFLTGAIVGVILILAKKAKFKQKIAFGPFLSLGTIIACLWGENILKLVQNFLF